MGDNKDRMVAGLVAIVCVAIGWSFFFLDFNFGSVVDKPINSTHVPSDKNTYEFPVGVTRKVLMINSNPYTVFIPPKSCFSYFPQENVSVLESASTYMELVSKNNQQVAITFTVYDQRSDFCKSE